MPPYAQHVVIRTGNNDWSSKIEDEPDTMGTDTGGVNFARELKRLVGRGGKFHDVGIRAISDPSRKLCGRVDLDELISAQLMRDAHV